MIPALEATNLFDDRPWGEWRMVVERVTWLAVFGDDAPELPHAAAHRGRLNPIHEGRGPSTPHGVPEDCALAGDVSAMT